MSKYIAKIETMQKIYDNELREWAKKEFELNDTELEEYMKENCAANTNFGFNGCEDYINRAMQETSADKAYLIEGEACITESGKYIKWNSHTNLYKGGIMIVNLNDLEEDEGE